MTNVSSYREVDRFRSEFFCRGGAADATGVFETGALRDQGSLSEWASRITFEHVPREVLAEMDIKDGLALGPTFPGSRSGVRVGQTFRLCFGQGLFRDEDTLTLITPARSAEPDKNCAERRILRGTTGKRGIAGRYEDEVGEVRAGHAQWTLILHAEPAPSPEFLPAFGAGRVTHNFEDDNVFVLLAMT